MRTSIGRLTSTFSNNQRCLPPLATITECVHAGYGIADVVLNIGPSKRKKWCEEALGIGCWTIGRKGGQLRVGSVKEGAQSLGITP